MRLSTPHLFFAAAMTVALAGCSDNDKPDFYNGTGSLTVAVAVDIDPSLPVAPELFPEPSDFTITMASADGSVSHTWASIDDFTQGARFLSGDYVISASYGSPGAMDSWDIPCMAAEEKIHISEGQSVSVTLRAGLSSGVVSLKRSEEFVSRFGDNLITYHPEGAGYFEFGSEEDGDGPIFVAPGRGTLSMAAEGIDGELNFLLTRDIVTSGGKITEITVDYVGDESAVVVDATTGGETSVHAEIVFKPEMLRGSGPAVSVVSGRYEQIEHTLPEVPMIFTVTHEVPLSSVLLTIESQSLIAAGAPVECDIMDLTESEREFFTKRGVALPETFDGDVSIDLTPLFASLGYSDRGVNRSLFAVGAVDALSRMNTPPAMVTVVTLPVDLVVESVAPIVIGLNKSSLTVVSPSGDPLPYLTLTGDGKPLEITAGENLGDGRYRISFNTDGSTGPMRLDVYYDGVLRESVTVERVSPEYTIEADAFATMVVMRLSAKDPDLKAVITDNLKVMVNGRPAVLFERDNERFDLVVTGLEPSSPYIIVTSLKPDPLSDPEARTVKIVTEPAPAIPNGDFEDVKNTVKYRDMASGGAYSQTFAEIFNCQNHTSFDYWTPTKWANTNVKTFNGHSNRHNTWYMQPSVFSTMESASGDYAVELVSVAFDPDGPEIEPYLQESLPYTGYSRNIPEIAFRAAGRLFLGSYDYNVFTGVETYNEGIPFDARPMTLSGFYLYQPSRADFADKGEVSVEVLGIVDGREKVIASASESLVAAAGSGYSAFKVALEYPYFGVKATRLRVMFSSSMCDKSVSAETERIKTWDDPSASASIGSRLRIDNITLAY